MRNAGMAPAVCGLVMALSCGGGGGDGTDPADTPDSVTDGAGIDTAGDLGGDSGDIPVPDGSRSADLATKDTVLEDSSAPPEDGMEESTEDSAPCLCEDAECTALYPELGQCERAFCDSSTCTCTAGTAEDGTDCDDLDPCTIDDACEDGLCDGYAIPCECKVDEDCALLEDGDLCNGTLFCDTSGFLYVCAVDPLTVIQCPDPTDPEVICLEPSCAPDTGGCSLVAVTDGLPCDDGDPCTEFDACSTGICVGPQVTVCDDGDPCTQDSCVPPDGCGHAPIEGACEDGDACTEDDSCMDGACIAGTPLDCDDGNPCTDNSCDPEFGCVTALNEAACNDGNPCTTGDHCALGECIGAGAPTCDDGNPCTDDTCDSEEGCTFTPKVGDCDDGNACTSGDHCDDGLCIAAEIIDCGDDNPCTEDLCDVEIGCQHDPVDAACDDGDACTTGDACQGGTCVGQGQTICDDDNPCTDETCVSPGGCVFTENSDACDDGDACTEVDACSGGACLGTGEENCDDEDVCTIDVCMPATGCVYYKVPDGLPCDDGGPWQCQDGVCECVPQCLAGGGCGDDGCSGSCGSCPMNGFCDDGLCACSPGFEGETCDACEDGHFGPTCEECPGGTDNPCNGMGSCDDGISGTGVCDCLPGFDPPACTVCPTPDQPGAISGPEIVGENQQDVGYSIQPMEGADSYEWTAFDGAVVTGGFGTYAVSVTFGVTSGDLCVSAVNECGPSEPRCIAVVASPCEGVPYPNANLAYFTEKDAGFRDICVDGEIYSWDEADGFYLRDGDTILVPDMGSTTVNADSFHGFQGGTPSSDAFQWDDETVLTTQLQWDEAKLFVSPVSSADMSYCEALGGNPDVACDPEDSEVNIAAPLVYGGGAFGPGTYAVYDGGEQIPAGTLKGTYPDLFSQQPLAQVSYCVATYGLGWRLPTDIEAGHGNDQEGSVGFQAGYQSPAYKNIHTSARFIDQAHKRWVVTLANGNWTVSAFGVAYEQYSRCVYAPVPTPGMPPETPGPITGDEAVSQNQVGKEYSIDPVYGQTGYTWTVPEGAVITSGQGSTAIIVDFGALPGDVCVTADNNWGPSPTNCKAIQVAQTHDYANANEAYWTEKDLGWNIITVGDNTYTWDAENLFYNRQEGAYILIPDLASTEVPADAFYGFQGGEISLTGWNWDDATVMPQPSPFDVGKLFVGPRSETSMNICQALDADAPGCGAVTIEAPVLFPWAPIVEGVYDLGAGEGTFNAGSLPGQDVFYQQSLTGSSWCGQTYGQGWRLPTPQEIGESGSLASMYFLVWTWSANCNECPLYLFTGSPVILKVMPGNGCIGCWKYVYNWDNGCAYMGFGNVSTNTQSRIRCVYAGGRDGESY